MDSDWNRNWVLRTILEHSRACPNSLAIESVSGQAVTYGDLIGIVEDRAKYLCSLGLSQGGSVVIRSNLDVGLVVSYLAVWLVGGSFCPVSIDAPDRYFSEAILRVVPAVVLDGRDLHNYSHAGTIATGRVQSEIAYSIFSSGSSGVPKCVDVTHAGIECVISQQIKLFRISPTSRVGAILSPAFDASISDILCALCGGATLIVGTPKTWSSSDVLGHICDNSITVIDIPPVVLSKIPAADSPSCLETVIIGGEVPDLDSVHAWSSAVHLVSVYGPTEATICSSALVCTADWKSGEIGVPFRDVGFHIEAIEDDCRSANTGELWISGEVLAAGYHGDPELTRVKFVERGGKRFYRTGDLVRRTEAGTYTFLGRLDRQFKHSGRLIEPRQIEVAAETLPEVQVSFALQLIDGGKSRIGLAVESRDSHIDSSYIRRRLIQLLPRWMVPSRILVLSDLPRGYSMKLDRAGIERLFRSSAPVVSNTGTWIDILRSFIPEFDPGLDLSFPDYAVDSFMAIEIAEAFSQFGIEILPRDILSSRSIGDVLMNRKAPEPESRSTRDLHRLVKRIVGGSRTRRFTKRELRSVIIVGANGRIGSALSRSLAQRGLKVVGFVRKGANPDPIGGVAIQEYNPEEAYLGVEKNRLRALCEESEIIINCVGDISALKGLESLVVTNLRLPCRLASVALLFPHLQFAHISSLSVFLDSSRQDAPWSEDDTLEGEYEVIGAYAQSKWLAERSLLSSQALRQRLSIFRAGLVFPAVGEQNFKFSDAFVRLIKEILDLGAVPIEKLDLFVDVTPVEQLASAIGDILGSDDYAGSFHLCSIQGISLRQIVYELECLGFSIKIIESKEFGELQKKSGRSSNWSIEGNELDPLSILKMREGLFRHNRTSEILNQEPISAISGGELQSYLKMAISQI